jgi:prefoldin subunit 5
MSRAYDTYKNIFNGTDESLKEIKDRIDCLQRSQVYVHDHITKVEKNIDELKSLILRRLTDVESYDMQMAEVN